VPKTEIDYESFCGKVEFAVATLNKGVIPDMKDCRYDIVRLEEGGLFHICLIRAIGSDRPTFHIARILMGAFYPDMSKEEFMALSDHVVSGRTSIEAFDAIPIHVLYEFFCVPK